MNWNVNEIQPGSFISSRSGSALMLSVIRKGNRIKITYVHVCDQNVEIITGSVDTRLTHTCDEIII